MTISTSPISSLALPPDCRDAAALLNRGCFCSSMNNESLRQALAGGGGLLADLLTTRPHLFSDTRVYVAQAHLQIMADLIGVIERVVAMTAWSERVLAYAPAIAHHHSAAAGVFLGYDFHLSVGGPRLIEINTNAGGGLLNAKLLRAQNACCTPLAVLPGKAPEERFVDMFREEWRLARGDALLERIAIVDAAPATQFLAPEFELFRQLFEANGILAMIADPGELSFDGQRLRCRGQTVDLVYNRLTDFPLDDAPNAALRAAYLANAVVLTSHPRAHALYADKRNLAALTDEPWLQAVGVSAADRQLLKAGVPLTQEVLPEQAESFWSSRKRWFFKPAAGYGSKATYRGDKLTKRVFAEISRGGYVAQALVAPSKRRLLVDGLEQDFKLDLRNYVYCGAVQLVSARLYQGQTTNFRTRGGGFAAVFSVGCQDESKLCK
ncbi:hypothetical protein [Propionivibrio sp.]|uniref:hypothetical protein n=1 Tax=Propionivibrio sp. TaxID=2212460 RepID=UPI00260F9A9E|nr:hypothetical protein [Propionivibrio sp.]